MPLRHANTKAEWLAILAEGKTVRARVLLLLLLLLLITDHMLRAQDRAQACSARAPRQRERDG
jgi:hypothetical protein